MLDQIVRGARLRVHITGEGPETLLFVHGLMLASESWERQRECFSDRYRVVTFDLRGQGASEKTTEGLDLDALAEDTAALAATLGGPVHLVGFSMGAFIALRVAARHPERVRSLTLVGASAAGESRWKMPLYTALITWVRWFGPSLLTRPLLRILFGRTFLRSRSAERERWRTVLRGLPPSLAAAASASAHRGAIHGELAAIRAPTLVISGAEDRPVPTPLARAVAERIAGPRLEVVEDAGHAVMIERPERFDVLLGAFLAEHAVGAPRGPRTPQQ